MNMKQTTPNTTTSNGVPTPTTTPPPATENKKFVDAPIKAPAFKADIAEGDSPKVLATEPIVGPPKEELPEPAVESSQAEDAGKESEAREHDIYADAVLACKLSDTLRSTADNM